MQKVTGDVVVMNIMKTYSEKFSGVCLIDFSECLSLYVADRCHSCISTGIYERLRGFLKFFVCLQYMYFL